MKKFYNPGDIFTYNGNNYEVIAGNAENDFDVCGKCAFCTKPGKCDLIEYDKLAYTCSFMTRPDKNDIYFVKTDKEPNVIEDSSNNDSNASITEEMTENSPSFEENVSVNMNNTPSFSTKFPPVSIVKALDLGGAPISGILFNSQNGTKYIMPYGSKVMMDGTCNLVEFQSDTLSYQTPYRDMNGDKIYTNDYIKLYTPSKNSYSEHVIKEVRVGIMSDGSFCFYDDEIGFDCGEYVDLENNTVLNGIVYSDKEDKGILNLTVLNNFANIKETLISFMCNGTELGAEERKTFYKMYAVEEFLKNC